MPEFEDFQVETANPKMLDETVQQLGTAVVIDGSWDGKVCTIRAFGGCAGYLKFAIENQGYGRVV